MLNLDVEMRKSNWELINGDDVDCYCLREIQQLGGQQMGKCYFVLAGGLNWIVSLPEGGVN